MQEIIPSTGPLLFKLRPLILIAVYSFTLFFGTRLILATGDNKRYYWVLLIIGSVTGFVAANATPGFARLLTEQMYSTLIGIAASPLALSIHVGSIVAAIGLIGIAKHKMPF